MPRDIKNKREWERKRALKNGEYIRSIKESQSCEICSESRAVCLDFHHRDRSTKSFSVGLHSNRSFATIDAEIAKCMIICSNCHRVLHNQERLNRIAATPEDSFPLIGNRTRKE